MRLAAGGEYCYTGFFAHGNLTKATDSYIFEEKDYEWRKLFMVRQETDWGEILWLADNKEILSIQGLQVGIVSLFPGSFQQKHIHYDEQVIYVIQGQAISVLDGEKSSLSPGDFFHWKVGVEHQILNIGNVPFQHLLISNPELEESDQFFLVDEEDNRKPVSPDLIYLAVEAIRTQFLGTLHYGYTIFDSVGNLVSQSQFFPEYCVECCQPMNNKGACACMRQIPQEERDQEHIYQCSYGMEVFHYPIRFKGVFLGYIQSGYIRHSSKERGRIESVYDAPESVVAGIKSLLRKIVTAIKNFCEFEQFRQELMEKELRIASHEESQRILMKNLQDTQYAMTELKISNHFLFNTLNSMASMALDGGLMPLYQSIVDLSKMFHYTLRAQNSMVSLGKEVEYVRAYLQLQKLRYGEDLEVSYRISRQLLTVTVPFNFLQPIVENAFVHGFSETVKKKIKVTVSKKKEWVEIQVINSGISLSPQDCYVINQGILGNTSHGLSMIYHKLRAIYGENCGFEIGTAKSGDTCFRVQIPLERKDTGGETV